MQTAPPKHEIAYPDTDGQPIANNTKQAQAMMVLKENLDLLHRHRNDVFITLTTSGVPWKTSRNPPCARCDGGVRQT